MKLNKWMITGACVGAVLYIAAPGTGTSTTEQRAAQRADQVQAAALASLKRSLRDADSAKIEGVRYVSAEAGEAVCGLVNAKNGFGAYIGWRPFVVNDQGVLMNSAPAWRKYCS